MMISDSRLLGCLWIVGIAGLLVSCSPPTLPPNENLPPNTTLANIPVNNDTLFALVKLHWDGEDNDGFIAFYEYRYITHHLNESGMLIDSLVQDWKKTTESSIEIAFESTASLNYQIFQVRAVDNDGNADPSPAEKRIYTVQSILPESEILFPSNNDIYFVIDQVTDWWQGIQLSFTAKDRDGEIVEYAWRVNDNDWTWTRDTTVFISPSQFTPQLEGNHVLSVISRDNTNLVDPIGDKVAIRLVKPTFSRKLLIIDETDERNIPSNLRPTDAAVDSFYADLFGITESWDYKTRGMPPKDTLGMYQLVFWHADDRPSVEPHAIVLHTEEMKDYLNVGGDLIISGWRILKSFAWGKNFPVTFPDGSFVADYLHIITADETPAVPSDFDRAEGEGIFKSVEVDTSKLNAFPFAGKLTQINVVTARAGFTEPIYRYSENTQFGPFRFQPVGLRYFGTSFDLVVLGFPIYFIVKEDAVILVDQVLGSMGY